MTNVLLWGIIMESLGIENTRSSWGSDNFVLGSENWVEIALGTHYLQL